MAADHAYGFAGARLAAHGVFGAGFEQNFFLEGVELAFAGAQPDGAAPHALRAQRQAGGDLAATGNAASGQHRHFASAGFNHLGHQHHGGDLAGVAAGLGALGDDHIDPGLHMAGRVVGLAAHRADHDLALAQQGDYIRRGRAQRADHHFDLRVLERHGQQAARAVGRHAATAFDDLAGDALALAVGQRWHLRVG